MTHKKPSTEENFRGCDPEEKRMGGKDEEVQMSLIQKYSKCEPNYILGQPGDKCFSSDDRQVILMNFSGIENETLDTCRNTKLSYIIMKKNYLLFTMTILCSKCVA
jgi:hypothetical protein